MLINSATVQKRNIYVLCIILPSFIYIFTLAHTHRHKFVWLDVCLGKGRSVSKYECVFGDREIESEYECKVV